MSATQGNYSDDQALLDISSGVRVSPTAYGPSLPERPRPRAPGARRASSRAGTRRSSAPPTPRPPSDPGCSRRRSPAARPTSGAAGQRTVDAVAAADRAGRVADGLARTGPDARRAHAARSCAGIASSWSTLPSQDADADLDALLAARAPDELRDRRAAAARRPGAPVPAHRHGRARDGGARPALEHHASRRRGDGHRPDAHRAAPPRPRRPRRGHGLAHPARPARVRVRRWSRCASATRHVAPRRIRALEVMLAGWALLLAALRAGRPRARRPAHGALAFLWLPAIVLVPGRDRPVQRDVRGPADHRPRARPGRADRPPRAPGRARPLVPAAVTLAVYLADLATGSNLITLSLLGPNPRAGARFYGIGNELEPALPDPAVRRPGGAVHGPRALARRGRRPSRSAGWRSRWPSARACSAPTSAA